MLKPISIACIVDDDNIYCFGLQRMMQIKKFAEKILVFNEAPKALDFLTKVLNLPDELPNVILLDINMPIMDGWQFIDEFVKISPRFGRKIIVYMVSSSINDRDIQHAKQYSEISDYVVKPIVPERLEDLLQQYYADLAQI